MLSFVAGDQSPMSSALIAGDGQRFNMHLSDTAGFCQQPDRTSGSGGSNQRVRTTGIAATAVSPRPVLRFRLESWRGKTRVLQEVR
jgi:hypothetical protein